MFKNSFFVFLFLILTATSYAQSVTKNLVYESTIGDPEEDRNSFYTVSPNGRFIVLGCGNLLRSMNSSANICNMDNSNFQVYDTYLKKLKSINLRSVFTHSKSVFTFTFSQDSRLIIAELPVTDNYFNLSDDFVPKDYKQKLVNVNLRTSMVESEFTSDGGKICTQLGYFADQIVCAQNTFRKTSDGVYVKDLDLVFYDEKFSRILKSVAVSKNSSYLLIPQLNDTEFISKRSSRPSKMLVVSKDNIGNSVSTGNSFSIDYKTGDVQLIPELDKVSHVRFVGNYDINNSSNSLYLLSYYYELNDQFLILNENSFIRIDVPSSLGEFDSKNVLGVSTNESGLPVIFISNRLRIDNDDSLNQLTIKAYSIFTGDESTILSLEYDNNHFNNSVVWDDNSESFFLMNGVTSESPDDNSFISEIQQVDRNGVTLQRNAAAIKGGQFFLNPRSSNLIFAGYTQDVLTSFFAYSTSKRKTKLIDIGNLNIPFDTDYQAPIFVSENALAFISLFGNRNFSIYYYEY